MLLFQINLTGCEKEEKFAYIQYLNVTVLRDKVDRALEYVRLRWTTEDGNDYTSAQRYWGSKAQQRKAGA